MVKKESILFGLLLRKAKISMSLLNLRMTQAIKLKIKSMRKKK